VNDLHSYKRTPMHDIDSLILHLKVKHTAFHLKVGIDIKQYDAKKQKASS